MLFGSVCSGIEAASVAFAPLGWKAAYFSEVAPFPCDLLAYHYPEVLNHGDFTDASNPIYHTEIDLLVGGTPCTDFSAAGKRAGWQGDKGSLTLSYMHLLRSIRPQWFIWENVPGVIEGRNMRKGFLGFIHELNQIGYGVGWRIFDSRYVRSDHFPRGLSQRRRRIYVVGYLGDWIPPAVVLFDRQSMQGSPSSRKGSKNNLPQTTQRSSANTVYGIPGNWIGRLPHNGSNQVQPCLNYSPCITATDKHGVCTKTEIRYLTPLELERLQGFPDNYTRIVYRGSLAKDSLRLKALGNSMSINVMEAIGKRIQIVDAFTKEKE